ncbi:MAG: hypothetical protein NVS3B5_09320 [Sphingomicrobium sp.]
MQEMQIHQQRAELINLQRLVDGAIYEAPMTRAEEALVLGLWRSACHYAAGSKIESSRGVQLITSGWAAWMRYGADGRRLIFLFLIPGDFIVPELFGIEGCDLVALMAIRTVDAGSLTDEETGAPQSSAIIARSGRNYQLLLLDHLTRLTMGSTTSSLANLLSEFHQRSIRSGASVGGRFSFPIGQRVLACALGRSAVQINKVMSHFQAKKLIRVGYDWIDMLEPEKLASYTGLAPRNSGMPLEAEASEIPV